MGQGAEWWQILVLVLMALLSALANGLNLGIMSLEPRYLELSIAGPYETKKDEREAKMAKKVLPLRRHGNLLLCTILLCVAGANSLFAIIMAQVTDEWTGFIISTTVIVIFGEIIPQAVGARFGLQFSYYTIYLTYTLVALLFIISYPIAAILDKILGEEVGVVLSKSQMKRLFEQYERASFLKPSERKMLSAALELQQMTAGSIMTPLQNVFMLDINCNLDDQLMRTIYHEGYSRIPIYEGSRDNIVGILMARDLIVINIDRQLITLKQLSSILVRDVVLIDHMTKIEPVLSFFKKGQTHMAIVTRVHEEVGKDPEFRKIGVITLEDIIEELLQEEIVDEQEIEDIKGERKAIKEKMIQLFADHQASQVLNDSERFAVCEFLSQKVAPFGAKYMHRKVLEQLVAQSDVAEIESDNIPFNHNIDRLEYLPDIRPQEVQNEEQIYFYQHLKMSQEQKHIEKIKTKKSEMVIIKNEPEVAAPTPDPTKDHQPAIAPAVLQHMPIIKLDPTDELIFSPKKMQMDVGAEQRSEMGDDEIPEEELSVEHERETMLRKRQLEGLKRDINPIIYIRDVPTDEFYLILQGKVTVCTGQDGFLLERGPFQTLGLGALLEEDYRPDFSAKVKSYAKMLKIRREDYQAAIKAKTVFKK